MQTKLEISEKTCDYIESLQYETAARRDLLAFAMERGLHETPAWQTYSKEYVECYASWETAKQEMFLREILPRCPGAKRWSLDFPSHTVTVEADG